MAIVVPIAEVKSRVSGESAEQVSTLHDVANMLPAEMSGLINPLILLYLVARPRWRRGFALAILTCMVATWICLALWRFIPLAGHILWIVGILLILSRELRSK